MKITGIEPILTGKRYLVVKVHTDSGIVGFDVGSSVADSGSFLLPGALIVLRCKPSPRAKMFRGGEHGHIHADFRNNAYGGKGLEPRSRCNNVELREIFLGSR